MTAFRCSRRDVLGATAAVGTVALSGCLGGAPDCSDEDVTVVFRPRVRGWYVSYPAPEEADVGNEIGGAPAREFVRLARDEGYTAEYDLIEDLGRYDDDHEWQIELYADVDRSAVDTLVEEADLPRETDVSENSGSTLRSSVLRWPWAPGLMEGRSGYLEGHAGAVDVSLPEFGPASKKIASLAESAPEDATAWIAQALSGRSVLTVELLDVPDDDNPLNEYRASNYAPPEESDGEGEFRHGKRNVSLHPDGTVDTGVFLQSMLKTIYRPGRDDSLAFLDRAHLRITLDDDVVEERPLADDERSYLEAYSQYIEEGDIGDDERPEAPRLRLTTIDGRQALRAATLLRWPTDVRFDVTTDRCSTEGR